MRRVKAISKRFLNAHRHEYSALPPNFVNCHFTSVWFYIISRPKFSIKNLYCRVPVKQVMVKQIRDYRAKG